MAEILDLFVTNTLFGLLLVFTRISAAVMFMPGFGEQFVTVQSKLAFAIAVAIIITPLVLPSLPALPGSALQLFLLLFFEVFVGVFLGLLTRLVFAAFEIAGMMMSFQVSLGNATIFNPAMATQGSLLSVLISVAGILLIFVTNMHHLMLSAAVDTFTLFQPGNFILPVGDMADFFAGLAGPPDATGSGVFCRHPPTDFIRVFRVILNDIGDHAVVCGSF